MVVITNKHIFFAGPVKALRVPYAKIVSFQPFSNGMGIIRDASNAKAQIFVTGDGWFTYNLVTNLANLCDTTTVTKKPVDSSVDITFDCPRCGQRLAVEQRGAGISVNCPSCHQQIAIPPK
jgi:hypothetical protein